MAVRLPCRCDMLPFSSASRKTNHYHCPNCIAIFKQKGHFWQPWRGHLTKIANLQKKKNCFQVLPNKSNLQRKKNCFHVLLKHLKSQISLKTKVHLKIEWFLMLPLECSVLSVTLIWGKKVYRDTEKQSSNIQGTKYICFDNKECTYMVVKSQSKIRYPLHMQKLFYGKNAPKISCKNQCCMNFIKTYQANGLKNELFDHLKTVIVDHCFQSQFF